jgi:hypothetical protein
MTTLDPVLCDVVGSDAPSAPMQYPHVLTSYAYVCPHPCVQIGVLGQQSIDTFGYTNQINTVRVSYPPTASTF